MNVHTLTRTQFLPSPPEEVFVFFQSPENLGVITPPRLSFRILTPLPIVMGVGTLIDYTVRWLGVPVRWTTMITAYDAPRLFVDQQIRGPYSLWHHTHAFERRDGGTVMTDTVRYVVPYGLWGGFVHRVLVRRQVQEIFDYRAEAIARKFPTQHNAAEKEMHA